MSTIGNQMWNIIAEADEFYEDLVRINHVHAESVNSVVYGLMFIVRNMPATNHTVSCMQAMFDDIKVRAATHILENAAVG